MAKDKLIGTIILVLGIAIIFFYTVLGPIDKACSGFLEGSLLDNLTAWRNMLGLDWEWMVVLPMWLVVVVIGVIAAWIGYSMLTT
ncbi:MAG: hypothetical protein GF364_21180, partial [Candidatus Lokiarchaeota archaeon]|nr:hypothetical protein [Candidatus Lokiarchaeota archaeon]